MIITEDKQYDIFVASKIGSFKHVKYNTDLSRNTKKCIENLVDVKTLQKDDGITCMEFGNIDQTEILIGRRNKQIQTYHTIHGFTNSYTSDFAPGDVVGLGRCKRKLLAATASGVVRVWSKKVDETIDVGGKVDRMRVCADEPAFATGGEENDLRIYAIGESTPTFCAKNLAHDWLQLRRPVWVTDLAFMPGEGGRMVAVCSRHGYVRLYDTRAQRRPVCNVDFSMAATCITPGLDERQVVVGFGRGQVHQVDLRKARPDKGFKGAVGAVSTIALVKDSRLLVTGSLDRHLRVHQLDTKELVYKQYMTSKLSCVLVQTESSTPLQKSEVKEEGEGGEEVKVEDDDLDALFEIMETVGEKPKKKKVEATEKLPAKKMKPSTAGNIEGEYENSDNTEEAIVKLLRSTEKQKKKREQKKREKKAKSVFHNA